MSRRKELENLQYIFWPAFTRDDDHPLEKERTTLCTNLVRILEATQSKNDEKEFSKV